MGFVLWVVECAIYFPTLQIIGALLLFDHRRYAGKRPEHVLYPADRAGNNAHRSRPAPAAPPLI
jgi:hypothetical protein